MKEWSVLQDELIEDEKGVFHWLIFYQEYYVKKDCNCNPETCCCQYGWIREEVKRKKIYKS